MEPIPGLGARVVVEGLPKQEIGSHPIVWVPDTNGNGTAELIVGTSVGNQVLDDLMSGRDWTDLVVGTLPSGTGNFSFAGDTDHDGVGDLWLGRRLYRGPLTGARGWDDWDAILIEPFGEGMAGNVDADGDGQLDVIVGHWSQGLTVLYGPFDGEVPASDEAPGWDPSQALTTDHAEECMRQDVFVFGELNRPGELAVLVGGMTMPWCFGSVWGYDLAGPRGRHLTFDDAFAEFKGDSLQIDVLPDADGDGIVDLLYLGQPYSRPIEGFHYSSYGNGTEPVKLLLRDQESAFAIHDATGDGLGDVLIEVYPNGAPGPSWYVVPGTTRGEGLDPDAVGLLLAPIPQVNQADPRAQPLLPTWVSGDLDGDGIAELVAAQKNDDGRPGPGGWLWIYAGQDLVDAYAELALPEEAR